MQDIEMMDPECGQWKNSIVAVQAKVKTLGLKLQKKIEALQAALTEYREQLSIPCERNCEMGIHVHVRICVFVAMCVNFKMHLAHYVCGRVG